MDTCVHEYPRSVIIQYCPEPPPTARLAGYYYSTTRVE
jgi:hypothetical protein